MEISVSTSAWPRAGTVVACEEYRSYPAAKALPRVGRRALSDSFLTRNGGDCSRRGTLVVLFSAMVLVMELSLPVLTLFGGGEFGGEATGSAVML